MKYLILTTTLALCLAGCQNKTETSYDNPHFDVTRSGDQALALKEVRDAFRQEHPLAFSISFSFEETKDGIFVIYQWDQQESFSTKANGTQEVIQVEAGKWKQFIPNERLQEIITW